MAKPRERIRRKHRDSLVPSSPHGKDAKLAALVRGADNSAGPKAADALFEPKKIGKKAIFRPILASPFHARWPAITPVMQNVILHSLLYILQGTDAQRYFSRDKLTTPQGSSRKTKEKNKRRKARLAVKILEQQGILSNVRKEMSIREPPSTAAKGEDVAKERPFLCGLNSVTRQMEKLIRDELQSISISKSTLHSPTIIFVCQSDVDPPSLVSHFPLLCSTYNAVCKQNCYLIKLPLDSEKQISEATSLRRCSVFSIDLAQFEEGSESQKGFKELLGKLKEAKVEAIRMEWLDSAIASLQQRQKVGQHAPLHLLEPQIKHLKSSAPLDMNLVKATTRAKRATKRAARKVRSQAKIESRFNHISRGVKSKTK